jgi:hypothetical protein
MSNEVNNQIENKLKLLEYHRNAMEARRSIGFKAFLSLVGLYLIAIKGSADLIKNLECLIQEVFIKLIITIGFWLFFVLFVFFMVQIEHKNLLNRIKYISLEREISESLKGMKATEYTEKFERTIIKAWAATGPIIGILILAIISSLIIWCL